MTLLPAATWRLIKTPPAEGAWNMAVDEAILEAIGREEVQPTLRLYAWKPACLSLGYAQPFGDIDPDLIVAQGWQVVRRMTGGRAILHTDELTYSVIGPQHEPRLTGSVIESYQRLSKALLKALALLGLPVQATPKAGEAAGHRNTEPICFEVPSHYEITAAGKKLVGSAQARKKAGVLQHGTLPLHGDLTRIAQALAFPNEAQRQEAAERLLTRATTVEKVIERVVPWEECASAFREAFKTALNLNFEVTGLTPSESSRADELVKEKYAHPSWTERI
jgi:lipoyl(octanoyl) transferase